MLEVLVHSTPFIRGRKLPAWRSTWWPTVHLAELTCDHPSSPTQLHPFSIILRFTYDPAAPKCMPPHSLAKGSQPICLYLLRVIQTSSSNRNRTRWRGCSPSRNHTQFVSRHTLLRKLSSFEKQRAKETQPFLFFSCFFFFFDMNRSILLHSTLFLNHKTHT